MSITSLSKRLRGEAPCDPSPHVLVVVGYRGGTLRQSALHLARQAGVPLLTVDDLCPAPHPTPEGEVPTASAVFEIEALPCPVAVKVATGHGSEVNASGEVTDCLPTPPHYGGYVKGESNRLVDCYSGPLARAVTAVVEVPADGMVDKIPEIVESVTVPAGVPWAAHLVWVRAGAVSASATLGDTVRDRATLEWREKNLDTYSATAGEKFCGSVVDARTEWEAMNAHQPPSPLQGFLIRESTAWKRV